MDINPYASPQKDELQADLPRVSGSRELLWSAYLVASVLVAPIPCYGYFVNINKDSQNTFFWLLLAWGVTFVNIIVSFFHSRTLLERNSRMNIVWALAWMWLVVVFMMGVGGLRQAVMELLAG